MMWKFSEYKDHIAAKEDSGAVITYQELAAEGATLAAKIEERSLLFCFCTNTIGSILGYTSCMNHHIVPTLLASSLDTELRDYLIQTYGPRYLWLPTTMSGQFPDYKTVYEAFGYALVKTNLPEVYELHPNLALLLTTSGSTGSPKLVRQSYVNVEENLNSICQYLELTEHEKPITTLPMNYTYGLSIINSHLAVGATLLLTDYALMQKEFWAFLESEGATSFGGVPYTYEMLDKLRFFRRKCPSLRTMTQAGGKLSPELHRKFAQYAQDEEKQFVVMYGQTEATARMSYLPHEESLEKYGSMGVAIPGGRFSLIDLNQNIIEQSEVVGELVYEGLNVTMGYAQCGLDLQKGDERFGRLVTGDMAKRDSDGFYYIVGRKKRFLKIFGNRVNLDEIDGMIKKQFDYIECAATGVDDKMYIFVTDKELCHAVRSYIAEKTGLNPIAFQVIGIDAIPKNDAGKTLYKDLEPYFVKTT